jgi:hypothetical protein
MFEQIVAEIKRWASIVEKTAEHILNTQPVKTEEKKAEQEKAPY